MTGLVETLQRWQAEFTERVAMSDTRWALAGVLLVSAAAFVVFLVLRFTFSRGERQVERWRGVRIHPLRFQNQELLSAEETTKTVLAGVRLVKGAAYLLLAYVYVNFVFQIFPTTKALSDRLLGYLFDAVRGIGLAVVGYIPSLIFLILIFFAGRFIVRLTWVVFNGIAIGRIRVSGFEAEWAVPSFKIVRFLIVAFLAVIAFPYLPGSASPAFQGVSIFLGVLVSLGSSGAVSDVISGIVLTYTRAFRIGDRVRIADAQGDVLEKTLFVTRVRTIKNIDITIPNGLVMSNHIINFSAQARAEGILLHTTITIGYDVPWRRVEEALLEAARATEGILETPPPFVWQTALDDFYVHYELNASTREARKMGAVYSSLHRNVLERCHAAGIEIASPHLSAVRDGNQIQMPDEYLPKNYRPAAFRILPLRRSKTES